MIRPKQKRGGVRSHGGHARGPIVADARQKRALGTCKGSGRDVTAPQGGAQGTK